MPQSPTTRRKLAGVRARVRRSFAMRWLHSATLVSAVVFGAVAGCQIPEEVQSEIACTTVCTCLGGGVGLQRCIDGCIADGSLGRAPEDCFECIQAHAKTCSTLENDCEPLCATPQPVPEDDGTPDGGLPL